MARLGSNAIFLLLFLPFSVVRGRPESSHEPCEPYDTFFCTCDFPTDFQPVLVNMCLTSNNGTSSCEPCAGHSQNFIDCGECPDGVCPICSPTLQSARKRLGFTFSPMNGKVVYLTQESNKWNVRNKIDVYRENLKKRYSVKKRLPYSESWKQKDSVAPQQNLDKLSELEMENLQAEQIKSKPGSELTKPMEKINLSRNTSDRKETMTKVMKEKQVDSMSGSALTRWWDSGVVERNVSEQNDYTPGILNSKLISFKFNNFSIILRSDPSNENIIGIGLVLTKTASHNEVSTEQNISRLKGSGKIEFSTDNNFVLNSESMKSVAKEGEANSRKEALKPSFMNLTFEQFIYSNLGNEFKILGLPINKENKSVLNSDSEVLLENFPENIYTAVYCYKLSLTTLYFPKNGIRGKREHVRRNDPEPKLSYKLHIFQETTNISNSMDDNQSKALNLTLNFCFRNKFHNFSLSDSYNRNKRELRAESQCSLNKSRESLISDLGAVFEFRCSINREEIFTNSKSNKPFFVMKYSKKYKTNFFKTDLNMLILDIKNCLTTDKLIFYSNETKIDISNCQFTCLSDLVNTHAVKAIEISKTLGASSLIEFKMFENLISNIYLDVAMIMEFSENYSISELFEDTFLENTSDASFPVGGSVKLKLTLFFGEKLSAGEIKVKELSRSDQTKDVRDLFLSEILRLNERGENSSRDDVASGSYDVLSEKRTYYQNKGSHSDHLFRVFVPPKSRAIVNHSKSEGQNCSAECRVCKVSPNPPAMTESGSSADPPIIKCRTLKNLKNKFGCNCSVLPKPEIESIITRPNISLIFVRPQKPDSKFKKWQTEKTRDALKSNKYFDQIKAGGMDVIHFHNIGNDYHQKLINITKLFSMNLNRVPLFPGKRKRSIRENSNFEKYFGEMCYKNINFDFLSDDALPGDFVTKGQFHVAQRFNLKNSTKSRVERRTKSITSDTKNGNQKSGMFQNTDKFLKSEREASLPFYYFDADNLNIDEDVGEYADDVFYSFGMGLSDESMNFCLNGEYSRNTAGNIESGTIFMKMSSNGKKDALKTLDDETNVSIEDALKILMLSPFIKDHAEEKYDDKNKTNQQEARINSNDSINPYKERDSQFPQKVERNLMLAHGLEVGEFRGDGALGIDFEVEDDDVLGSDLVTADENVFGFDLTPEGDPFSVRGWQENAPSSLSNQEKQMNPADEMGNKNLGEDSSEKAANIKRILWIIEPFLNQTSDATNEVTSYMSGEEANISLSVEANVRNQSDTSPTSGTRANNAPHEGIESDRLKTYDASDEGDKVKPVFESQDTDVRNKSGDEEVGFEMRENLEAKIHLQNMSENEIKDHTRGFNSRTKRCDDCRKPDVVTCIFETGDIQKCVDEFVGSIVPGGHQEIPNNDWCELRSIFRNGNLHCVFLNKQKICTVYCHEGYYIKGRKSAKMMCKKSENVWKPEDLVCKKGKKQPQVPPRPPQPPPPDYYYDPKDFPDYYESPKEDRPPPHPSHRTPPPHSPPTHPFFGRPTPEPGLHSSRGPRPHPTPGPYPHRNPYHPHGPGPAPPPPSGNPQVPYPPPPDYFYDQKDFPDYYGSHKDHRPSPGCTEGGGSPPQSHPTHPFFHRPTPQQGVHSSQGPRPHPHPGAPSYPQRNPYHQHGVVVPGPHRVPPPPNRPRPYPGPAPRPYPGPAPRPYPGPAPRPYPGPAPRPYPEPAPRPYPEPAPRPYPGPAPRPYPGPAPRPYPGPAGDMQEGQEYIP